MTTMIQPKLCDAILEGDALPGIFHTRKRCDLNKCVIP